METAERRGFRYMRYVMALLGSAAFTLMFMLKDIEKGAIWRFHALLNFSNELIYCITVGLITLVLAYTGVSFKNLSAKWTMVTVMALHAFHMFSFTHLNYYQLSSSIAVLTMIITVIGPGICAIAMHSMISQWSPPNERSIITSIVYLGIPVAAICNEITCPWYGRGIDCIIGLIVLWIILWCVMIDDSPEKQRCLISQDEKDYIRTSIENYWPRPSPKEDISLRSISTSKAFIGVVLIEGSNTLILSTISTYLLSQPFQAELLGFIGQAVVVLICGIVTTILLQRQIISFDFSRKIPAIIAMVVPILLIIMSCSLRIYGVRRVSSVISHTIIGAKFSGAITNIIDISPNYAPFLMAIVQIVNEILILIAYLAVERLHIVPGQLRDLVFVGPITVLVIVSALFYWKWGSTAQRTVTSNASDSTLEKGFSYGPLQEETKEPIKI